MEFECHYNVPLIHQFYAIVVFESSPDRGMTWMSGLYLLQANFHNFAELWGYTFEGKLNPQGEPMHMDGVAYNKNDMSELYAAGGTIGSIASLLHFMTFSSTCFATLFPRVLATMMISVGDWSTCWFGHMRLFCNYMNLLQILAILMSWTLYFMRCTKLKYPLSEEDAEDVDPALDCELHKPVKLNKKSIHVVQKQATMQDIDEDMVSGGASPAPHNPHVKKLADHARSQIVRALEKVFFRGTTLHKENYTAYEDMHAILTNQSKIMEQLQIANPPPPPRVKIPYERWNNTEIDWSIELPPEVDLDEEVSPIAP